METRYELLAEFLNENEDVRKQIEKIRLGLQNFLIIDFKELIEFDPSLGEYACNSYKNFVIDVNLILEKKNLTVVFKNLTYDKKLNIRDIRVDNLNKVYFFEGIIKHKTKVYPEIISVIYRCRNCLEFFTISKSLFEKVNKKIKCKKCNGILEKTDEILIDLQLIKLEELPEILSERGHPEAIEVVLRGSYLTSIEKEHIINPGRRVKVIGVVKKAKMKDKEVFYIDAINIELLEKEDLEITLTEKDIKEIEKVAKKDPIKYLSKFIAPNIYGYNELKEAIVLQVLGGVKQEMEDGTQRRGNVHILVIGDPSTGKSTIAKSVEKLVPRAIFASGKGATGAGLTYAVVRDDLTGNWALEAGAMVLANKSVLILDELEKLDSENISALHQAMSLQRLSVNKANINATLITETSVLAIANPKKGRFEYDDFDKTVSEITGLSPTLLSRFDLIFQYVDTPNPERDEELLNFMFKRNRKVENINFFRKYVSYAKKIEPEWTREAFEKIKEFWMSLRQGSRDGKIMITIRQFEGLQRLAEASAKARLSKKVEAVDANKAIELMEKSLEQTGVITYGISNIDEPVNYTKKQKLKLIMDLIKELEKTSLTNSVKVNELQKKAEEKGIKESEFDDLLELLKRNSEIYFPRPNEVKTL